MSLLGKLRVVPSTLSHRFAVEYCKADGAPGRIVKSALGHDYVLKSHPMADLLCLELQGSVQTRQSVSKAVTRALQIGSQPDSKEECIANLTRFYSTDTCLFRDSGSLENVPEWDKCIALFSDLTKVKPLVNYGILRNTNDSFEDEIKTIIKYYDNWRLAALELSAQHCKSFIIPLLLQNGLIETKEAVDCALFEQTKQSQQWGDLEEHRLERARLLMNIYLSKLMVVE